MRGFFCAQEARIIGIDFFDKEPNKDVKTQVLRHSKRKIASH
jgi:hypothetical protein